jgi:DNA-binding transcriptional regulator YiaG
MENRNLQKLFKSGDFDEMLHQGKQRTAKVAEEKATQEKAQLKELLEMVDEVDEIEEAFLTAEQAAVQLGVSAQTIRNWEKQEKLIPLQRTEGGHRRYSQSQITELKKNHNDFEIFMRIKPNDLLLSIQQILSSFNPEENISVSIKNDELNRRVYFTLDSEDGLCTFTKTLKMEE